MARRNSGKPLWAAVDRYLGDLLAPSDEHLDAALKANRKAGLPAIDVSPLQGKFLSVLVQMTQATRVLEIGLLGGYSTIWMARALPKGGRIVSLEFSPKHAEVASANLKRWPSGASGCACWTCSGKPAGACSRARRQVRPDLHRRGQREQSAVSGVGPETFAARIGDRGRQHRPPRRGDCSHERRRRHPGIAPLPGDDGGLPSAKLIRDADGWGEGAGRVCDGGCYQVDRQSGVPYDGSLVVDNLPSILCPFPNRCSPG